MRETGPVQVELLGDRDAAQQYVGQARTLLGIVKNQMALGGLSQSQRRFVLAGGVIVEVKSTNGVDFISVAAPERTSTTKESQQDTVESPKKGQYLYVTAALPNPVPYKGITTYVYPFPRAHLRLTEASYEGNADSYVVTQRAKIRSAAQVEGAASSGTLTVRRQLSGGVIARYNHFPVQFSDGPIPVGGYADGEVYASAGTAADYSTLKYSFVLDTVQPAQPPMRVISTTTDDVLATRSLSAGVADLLTTDWNGGNSFPLANGGQITFTVPEDAIYPIVETPPVLPSLEATVPLHKIIVNGHYLPDIPLRRVVVRGNYLPNTPLHKIRIWGYYLPNRPLHKIITHGITDYEAIGELRYESYSLEQGATMSYSDVYPIGGATWNIIVSAATLVDATQVRSGIANVFATGPYSDQAGARAALARAVEYANALNDAIIGDMITGYDATQASLNEMEYIVYSASHQARMYATILAPYGGVFPVSDAPWRIQISNATINDAGFIPSVISTTTGSGMGALAVATAQAVAYVNTLNEALLKANFEAILNIDQALNKLHFIEYQSQFHSEMSYADGQPRSPWIVAVTKPTQFSAPFATTVGYLSVTQGNGLPQLAAMVENIVADTNAANDALVGGVLVAEEAIKAAFGNVRYVDYVDRPVVYDLRYATANMPWSVSMSAPTLLPAAQVRSGATNIVAQGIGLPALAAALTAAVENANTLNTQIISGITGLDTAQGRLNDAWRTAVLSGKSRARAWKKKNSASVIADMRVGILPGTHIDHAGGQVVVPPSEVNLTSNDALANPGPVKDWMYWLRAMAPVSPGTYRQVPLQISHTDTQQLFTYTQGGTIFNSAQVTTRKFKASFTSDNGEVSGSVTGVNISEQVYDKYWTRSPNSQAFVLPAGQSIDQRRDRGDLLDYMMNALLSGAKSYGSPGDSKFALPSLSTISPNEYSNNYELSIADVVKRYRAEVPVLYAPGQTVSAALRAGTPTQENIWNDSALMPTLDETVDPPIVQRIAVTMIPFAYVKDGDSLGMFADPKDAEGAQAIEVYGAATYSYLYEEGQFRFESWTPLRDASGQTVGSKIVAINMPVEKVTLSEQVTKTDADGQPRTVTQDTSRVKNCILQYGPIVWPDLQDMAKAHNNDPLVSAVRSVFN